MVGRGYTLKKEDIHLEQRELRITGTIQRIRGKLVRTTPTRDHGDSWTRAILHNLL
jgi:hypothetical protein